MHRMIADFVTVLQWKPKEKLPEYGKNRPKQGKLGRLGEFYPSFSMSYRLFSTSHSCGKYRIIFQMLTPAS